MVKDETQGFVQAKKKHDPKLNYKASLLKAKRALDKVLSNLTAFPELQDEAKAIREKVLDRYMEEERKVPGLDT